MRLHEPFQVFVGPTVAVARHVAVKLPRVTEQRPKQPVVCTRGDAVDFVVGALRTRGNNPVAQAKDDWRTLTVLRTMMPDALPSSTQVWNDGR
jgi:hypothetical protein